MKRPFLSREKSAAAREDAAHLREDAVDLREGVAQIREGENQACAKGRPTPASREFIAAVAASDMSDDQSNILQQANEHLVIATLEAHDLA